MTKLDITHTKSYPNNIEYRRYVHPDSGASVEMVLDPTCENITFGLGFATIPENSKGIPHILEHSVLCGSKKYPLKDPFSALLRTSVQTFLNAITFHNLTLYPSASFVKQDFENLFDVYWDSVFNPLLLEETFWTQGVHPVKNNGKVTFQGVVYNEMKGYYSEPKTILWRALFNGLFGNTHWQYDSGGDPREILDLSYEELINFHKTRYSLSNLRLVFYGPLAFSTLESFVSRYFVNMPNTSNTRISDDLRLTFQASDQHHIYQKSKPTDRFWKVTSAFTSNQTNFVTADLFNACFMGFATAPLLKSLQDSNLGPNVLKTGVVDFPFGTAFAVGIQDLFEEIEPQSLVLRDIVYETLCKPIDDNLARSMYEHFKASFISNFLNNPNRGVEIIMKSAQNLAFDLGVDTTLDQIFDFLRKPFKETYAELDALRRGIGDSQTKIEVILEPSENFEKEFITKEEQVAVKLLKLFDDRKFNDIKGRLEKYREDLNEDISIVPSLSRGDFSKEIKKIDLKQVDKGFFELVVNSNGLAYTTFLYPLNVDLDSIYDLAFLSRVATQIGTRKTSPFEFSLKISECLSSLEIYPFWGKDYKSGELKCFLRIDTSFLEEKVSEAVEIISELREQLSFFKEPDIIKKQFEQFRAELINSLQASPQRFAKLFAQSLVDETAVLDEYYRGISQIEYIENISPEDLINRLQRVWDEVVCQSPTVFTTYFKGSDKLKLGGDCRSSRRLVVNLRDTASFPIHIPVDIQVSSACRSFVLKESLRYEARIVEKLISESYLWNEIRVKGGAYGSAIISSNWGSVFTCLSWDDPTPERSLRCFSRIEESYFKSWLTDSDIERVCVSTLGELESPLSPGGELARAVRNTVFSITDQDREEYKSKLFDFNLENFFHSLALLNNVSKSGEVIVGKCDTSQLSAVLRRDIKMKQ